ERVKSDGKLYELAEAPALDKKFAHDIDVVVDRLVVRPDAATRLADSLEQALKLADGLAVAELADAPNGVSPLDGETDRPKGSGRRSQSKDTPLPNPAPQGGREQTAHAGEEKTKLPTAAAAPYPPLLVSPKLA